MTDSARGFARRGALVGVVVAAALTALWVPALTCSGEGFECLGEGLITMAATPVVAVLVGWVAGRVARLHRPSVLAFLGPVAAFAAAQVAGLTGDATVPLGYLLGIGSYAMVAAVARPGTSGRGWIVAIALVLAGLLLPQHISSWQYDRERAARFERLDPPLLLAGLDGFSVRYVVDAYDRASLSYTLVEVDESADPSATVAQVEVEVTRPATPPGQCADLPDVLADPRCEPVAADRWLVTGDDDTQVLFVRVGEGLVSARADGDDVPEALLVTLTVRPTNGDELVDLD